MADFLFKALGSAEFDGTSDVVTTAFDIDPFQDRLMAWVQNVVNHEWVKKGWATSVAGTGLVGRNPVHQVLNREPKPGLIKQLGLKFPLLCTWPREGVPGEFSLEREQTDTTWSMLYVLGPLNEVEFQKLKAWLRIFPKIFALLIRARSHSEHDGGAVQFDTDKIEVSTLSVGRHQIGPANFGQDNDGIMFWAVEVEFRTLEVERSLDGADPDLEGFDILANSIGEGSVFDGIAGSS